MYGTTSRESARRTGQAFAMIHISNSRFNATLRDDQAVRLTVDAFPSGRNHEVRKRGCAVSVNDMNTERNTDWLQIRLKK